MYRYVTYSRYNKRCKGRTYRTVLEICRFTVDVAVRLSYLYNSLEEKLNHDYCQTCSFKSIGSSESGERTRPLERSPTTLKAAEGQMLVQTSSPLYHCSSGSTNSLPPGVLQPETYPPSERPVKHLSRNLRQYTFWNCLHLRWYWVPGNCCKPANAPSYRPRRLREVLQPTPTLISLEPPTPPLDTDTPTTSRLLEPWQLLHASPTPCTRGQPPHVAPPVYTYQLQRRREFL